MRIALPAVGQTAANGNDFYIRVMSTYVIANLLEAAQRYEIADGIRDYGLAGEGKPPRHSRHVLLGHARIDITLRESFGETLQHGIANVAADQPDAFIGLRTFHDGIDKRGTHQDADTSAIARSSSLAFGER